MRLPERFACNARLAAVCMSLVAACAAAAAELTGGGLALTIDDNGAVQRVRIGERDIPCNAGPFVALCDVTRGTDFVPGRGTAGAVSDGIELAFDGLDATATLRVSERAESLRFTCDLVGRQDLPARGILLRFALPADCLGWDWHDDMQTARPITGGKRYENVQALRAWPDLPEWADKPNLRIGAANRNFCTVVTGPVGLCIAPDITQPIIFRTCYDAVNRRLDLVYDLALSPDTASPNRWSFAFDLYACDAAWGMRDALQTYYRLAPQLFENYVPRPGQWMAFTNLRYVDNANEFEFGLQEGAPDPGYDDQIDVLDCTYFTHAGQFIRIPNHDPETDPPPPQETILAETEKNFEKRTGLDSVYREVGLHDADGNFQIPKTRVYGHYIAQFNLDPDLRYGKWHLERTAQQTASFAAKGARLDGFYYDGLTTGLNYRTDHFRTSSSPPLWDPVARKPVLNNFFSSCEFARAAAELLRPKGQITMMNGALHATFFVAPWLDVFGAETGLRIPRSSFNFIRSIIRHKPMLTLLKGNFEQEIGRDDIELYMKRALAYGVFPGFFDWPPSGLGPGGRYWAHPEYYERDRDLFRSYLPLVKTLADAGWEPVPYAGCTAEGLYIERYGPGSDGSLYLTVLNENGIPRQGTVSVNTQALGLTGRDLACTDLLTGTPVELKPGNNAITADISVPPDGVQMLQICTPEQAARWRLEMAETAVERGITMRAVDWGEKRPPLAVHWRADRAFYGRTSNNDRHALTLNGGHGDVSASQWAMLFQPEPSPVTLRVQASATDLKGHAEVRCRIAWVTPSFTHYEWRTLSLDEGTYGAKDFTTTIDSPHPLRAIWLQPRLTGNPTGALMLHEIRLQDAFGDDYVVDPAFREWYEPVPEHMRKRIEEDSGVLRDALAVAREAVQENVENAAARDAMQRVAFLAEQLREYVVTQHAENGCRRVLRDIETVERHLSVARLSAFGVSQPRIEGPRQAAPGDTVVLTVASDAPAGVQVTGVLSAQPGISLVPLPAGTGARLTIPADAVPGSVLPVPATITVARGSQTVSVTAHHQVRIVNPLEAAFTGLAVDSATGAVHIRASVTNHRKAPATVAVELTLGDGWQTPGPREIRLPPLDTVETELTATPLQPMPAGFVKAHLTVTGDKHKDSATRQVLVIPRNANRLGNSGFEEGPWTGGEQDTSVACSGNASLRLQNATVDRKQASQSVVLDQQTPGTILVSASSRAENVSGPPNREYSLYVDIYYTDGTPLYGRAVPFQTGTTDWQRAELVIEPEKPIRTVSVYLLLRGKAGTAWFDDVTLAEDPTRKGNIARQAVVEVDSSYSRYSAAPLTDGIVHVPEETHWSRESWASADTAADHSITLSFEEPRTVRNAAVFWSRDGGELKTAAELLLQARRDGDWKTVAQSTPPEPEPRTELTPANPVTARGFRILQPAGKGPRDRPNIMWVREVELYGEAN